MKIERLVRRENLLKELTLGNSRITVYQPKLRFESLEITIKSNNDRSMRNLTSTINISLHSMLEVLSSEVWGYFIEIDAQKKRKSFRSEIIDLGSNFWASDA